MSGRSNTYHASEQKVLGCWATYPGSWAKHLGREMILKTEALAGYPIGAPVSRQFRGQAYTCGTRQNGNFGLAEQD